jgi:integrase
MPKKLPPFEMAAILTLKHSRRTKSPEMFVTGDPSSLYLQITAQDGRSWILRTLVDGKRREIGLGGFPTFTNDRGGKKTQAHIEKVRNNARVITDALRACRGSEVSQSEALKTAMVTIGRPMHQTGDKANAFGVWALAWFARAVQPKLRNAVSVGQWEYTFNTICAPIASTQISAINRDDVLRVLRPIWTKTPETARRVRGRIERVLAAAMGAGLHPEGRNCASWEVLKHELPTIGKLQRGHHPSMPYRKVPDFYAKLAQANGMSALAHRFVILTAGRATEILGARWPEIDLTMALWTIPKGRMKAGNEHKVPLCDEALEVLRLARERTGDESGLVFAGDQGGKQMTPAAFEQCRERMGVDGITTHGFRASFRTWAAEQGVDRLIGERCLAHEVRTKEEFDYSHLANFEARQRKVLGDWASHVIGQKLCAV